MSSVLACFHNHPVVSVFWNHNPEPFCDALPAHTLSNNLVTVCFLKRAWNPLPETQQSHTPFFQGQVPTQPGKVKISLLFYGVTAQYNHLNHKKNFESGCHPRSRKYRLTFFLQPSWTSLMPRKTRYYEQVMETAIAASSYETCTLLSIQLVPHL
ncbi:hypothetical protein [Spongorhabdus nitratireducens]